MLIATALNNSIVKTEKRPDDLHDHRGDSFYNPITGQDD